MDVVNLSLSTSAEQYFDVFHDLVDRAAHAGIVLVAAMNNIRKATYPSQFAGVLSVAASRGDDPEVFWRNPRPPLSGARRASTVASPGSAAATPR